MAITGNGDSQGRLYALLEELNIEYIKYEHPAFFTVEEGDLLGFEAPGLNLKNLFIRDKKTGDYFLVILDDHRRLDFKAFRLLTDWKHPTFATDAELMRFLGLTPGSVTPFGLINDEARAVTVVLDKCIGEADGEELVNFHPNTNTATLGIKKKDFLRFLAYRGNRILQET